jgi:hemerythrin-like domain-containing protein
MATGMLKMLEKAPRTNSKLQRAIMDRIHREFLAHETAEDDVLYQMIRNRGLSAAGPQVEQAYREQDQVRDMLYRFDRIDPMSDEFGPRLHELVQMMERHTDREERYVFPYIESLLSKEEQEALGRQLQASKKEWKEHLTAA